MNGMAYNRTQYGRWHYLLVVFTAATLLAVWLTRRTFDAWLWPRELVMLDAVLVIAAIFALCGLLFGSLTIRDEGQWLALRFGPLPLIHKRICYAEITDVEAGRSRILDGWGIHYFPGRGWTYNIWGFRLRETDAGPEDYSHRQRRRGEPGKVPAREIASLRLANSAVVENNGWWNVYPAALNRRMVETGYKAVLPTRCPAPLNRMIAPILRQVPNLSYRPAPPIGLSRVICLLAGLVSLTALSFPPKMASACSVPVFRYALERFQADPYCFTVYYRGSLTGQAKAAVDALQRIGADSGPAANFDVKTVDLAAPPQPAAKDTAAKDTVAKDGAKPDETAEAWTPPKNAKLPWLAVTLPGDDSTPLWSAPLEIQDLPRLVDSPVRRQIVKRLLGGESAVFLVLESGRKEEDARIAKLLAATIQKMQKDLELPPDDGTGRPQSELPLRIAFSVLTVRRDDPAEVLLVKTMESTLEQSKAKNKAEGGAIICPIFGRGRILAAVSGQDVTAEKLEAACQFLCGACACTLKGELSGTDLLLTADWDALLENRVVRDDPPALRSLGPWPRRRLPVRRIPQWRLPQRPLPRRRIPPRLPLRSRRPCPRLCNRRPRRPRMTPGGAECSAWWPQPWPHCSAKS